MEKMKRMSIALGRCVKAQLLVSAMLMMGLNASAQKELELSEVTIKAHMPAHKIVKGGTSTRIVGSVLAKVGTAKNVILHLPNVQKKVDGSFEVMGKGTPIIYVNNRKLRDLSELDYLKSESIQNVEVITSPGAEYDASVGSVIRIKTLKNQEDGVGVNVTSSADYAHHWNTEHQVGIDWQKGKLETFATMRYGFTHQYETGTTDITTYLNNASVNKDNLTQNNTWNQYATSVDNGSTHSVYGKVGFNYDFSKNHSVGAMYELTSMPRTKMRSNNKTDLSMGNDAYDALDTYASSVERTEPTHHVSAYYAGKLGKLALNVDADALLGYKDGNEDVDESSLKYNHYIGGTSQYSKDRLYAGKLNLGYPIAQGNLSLGSEYTYTKRQSHSDGYQGVIAVSSNKIKEQNLGIFLGYDGNLGPVAANIGVRYEHVVYDFFEDEVKSADKSRTYDNFFPSVSLNTTIGNAHIGLDYNVRTFRPLYMMLESNTHYSNRYAYFSGTPDLQPTYIHAVELSGMYKDLRLAVGFNHYKNDIFMGMDQLESDARILNYQFKNLNGRNELTYSVSYAPTFGFWKPEVMVMANTQWLHSLHRGEQMNMNGTLCRINWNNAFLLPCDFILHIDGSWNSHGFEQNYKRFASGTVNASLNKDFCQGKWNILLEMSDIFHTMRDKARLYDAQSMMLRSTKDNTQQVKLTVSYNLNAKKSKYKGMGAGNEEIQRL